MEIKATSVIVLLFGFIIVSIAVVVPITSWVTNPQAVTEYAVDLWILGCAFIGSAFMVLISCACKGK